MRVVCVGSIAPEDPARPYFNNQLAARRMQLGYMRQLYTVTGNAIKIYSWIPLHRKIQLREALYIKSYNLNLGEGLDAVTAPILTIPLIGLLLTWMWLVLRLFKEFRQQKKEPLWVIIYNFNFIFFSAINFAKFLTLRKNAKITVMAADAPYWLRPSYNPDNHNSYKTKILRNITQRQIDKLDAVYANTRFMQAGLKARGVPTLLLHNGIHTPDIPAYVPLNRDKPFKLLYTGLLHELYGTTILMDALDYLPEYFSLTLCGWGFPEYEAEIHRREAMNPRLSFLGKVPTEKALLLQQQATLLFILMDKSASGFPSKCYEYMASGRVIVSSYQSDIKASFAGHIVFLPERTPETLSIICKELCADLDALEERGKRTREYALNELTWEKQCKRMYDFTWRQPCTGQSDL